MILFCFVIVNHLNTNFLLHTKIYSWYFYWVEPQIEIITSFFQITFSTTLTEYGSDQPTDWDKEEERDAVTDLYMIYIHNLGKRPFILYSFY